MRYLLFIGGDETLELSSEEAARVQEDTIAWVREMDGRGVRLQGDRRANTSGATTVRVRDGDVLLADGPFAETKEQIGGFDLLECAALDEALEVAAKNPGASFGVLELRAIEPDA